jgi:hypothetical protein
MRFVPHPRKWMRVSMSVFLLVGAEPSLRARAHAGCGKPVPDSERLAPNAITGADTPNDTVLQIKSVVLNSTLVYGNPVTELPLRRAKLDWHAPQNGVPPTMLTGPIRSLTGTWLAAALVRRISRKWHLVDVVSTSHRRCLPSPTRRSNNSALCCRRDSACGTKRTCRPRCAVCDRGTASSRHS